MVDLSNKTFVQNVNYLAGIDTKFGSTVVLNADNMPINLGSMYDIALTFEYYSLDTLRIVSNTYTSTGVSSDFFDIAVAGLVSKIDGTTFTRTETCYWNTSTVVPFKVVNISVTSNDDKIWVVGINLTISSSGTEVVSVNGDVQDPRQILPKIASYDQNFIDQVVRFSDLFADIAPKFDELYAEIVPNIDELLLVNDNAILAADSLAAVQALKQQIEADYAFAQTLTVSYTVVPLGDPATISYDPVANHIDFGIPTGPKGDTGEKGVQGLSAYEVAVANGFIGTEIDWMQSLTGPQGMQGEIGPQGVQGIQGPAGATGAQGVSLIILGQVADVASLPDPTTLTLDQAYIVQDTGDLWFVDENNAWVNAGRIVGPQGDAGPQGPVGATGPQGAIGPQGPAGPIGAKGDKGDKGDAGTNGTDGVDGKSITSVTSSKVGTTTTVTISGTFTNSPQSFTIEDGTVSDGIYVKSSDLGTLADFISALG